MSIDQVLSTRPLIVCMGPGGVGKTSIAASLGLRAAWLGRRTLVMTIDPAKRLADAMGLRLGTDSIEEVPTSKLKELGVELKAPLHAAMFDHSMSMDALIRRVAPSDRISQSVLNNRIYRAMAGTLARSHAYLAMERLQENMAMEQYDLIILDTPPAQNALDILDAPNKLASFLEEGIMRWFLPDSITHSLDAESETTRRTDKGTFGSAIGSTSQRIREKLSAASGAAATKLLGLVLGQALVSEVVQFFSAFAQLRKGFLERAVEMGERLVDPTTGYVLVSSTQESHLQDTGSLLQGMQRRGIQPQAMVFNRSYESLAVDPQKIVVNNEFIGNPQWVEENWPELDRPEKQQVEELLIALGEHWGDVVAANQQSMKNVAKWVASSSPECLKIFVPQQDTEVCDLAGLFRLNAFLSQERS